LHLEKSFEIETQTVVGNASSSKVSQVIPVPDSLVHMFVSACDELEFLAFGPQSQCTKLELTDDRKQE